MNPTLPILTALTVLAAPAFAAEVAGPWQILAVPSELTNWHHDLLVVKFDPAVDLLPGYGLLRMEYVLLGEVVGDFVYQNTSTVPADVTFSTAGSVSTTSGFLSPLGLTIGAPPTSTTVAPGDTLPFSDSGSDSVSGSLTGIALSPFVGVGTLAIGLDADGASSLTENTGNAVYSIATSAAVELQVRFIQSTLVREIVPEGSTWNALAVLGFLIGWRIGRKLA